MKVTSKSIVRPNVISRKSALETILHTVRGGELSEYQGQVLIQELFGLAKETLNESVELDVDFIETLNGG